MGDIGLDHCLSPDFFNEQWVDQNSRPSHLEEKAHSSLWDVTGHMAGGRGRHYSEKLRSRVLSPPRNTEWGAAGGGVGGFARRKYQLTNEYTARKAWCLCRNSKIDRVGNAVGNAQGKFSTQNTHEWLDCTCATNGHMGGTSAHMPTQFFWHVFSSMTASPFLKSGVG